MNRKIISQLTLLWIAFSLLPSPGAAQQPAVRAIIFYSPTCPHCQQVLTVDLPPLVERYGDQLNILAVNVSTEGGSALFENAVTRYGITNLGVPALVVGDHFLIGAVEIPERFPILVEQYLAQGGVDWPDIPGLREAIAAIPTQTAPAETPTSSSNAAPSKAPTQGVIPKSTAPSKPSEAAKPTDVILAQATLPSGLILPEEHSLGLLEKLQRDLAGNTVAILLLIGMIAVVVRAVPHLKADPPAAAPAWHAWLFPLLIAIGLLAAGYLAYVETQQVEAVCGPVGDCNTVQQSSYARLFGMLPIGVLGMLGYLAILVAWLVKMFGDEKYRPLARLALLGLTLFGTLFSIYLTFLEPFVIGATCAWCLTSAVVMTTLFWLTIQPAHQ